MTPDIDRYRAPALDKGLDILELLAGQPLGLTRAEIVKAMGRSQSEIYRMLERLVARHYVTRSPQGDRYALSLKMFVLSHRHPPLDRLIMQAQPLLDQFANAAEQSCHMGVYDRGNVTVVAQARSPGIWGMSIRQGARVGLIDTGSGHVLLAFQSEARRADMLAAHDAVDGEVPVGREELGGLLAQVVASGRWEGASKQAAGIVDLSVPVLGPRGEALAVLTCPFLLRIDRHVGPDLAATGALLQDTAHRLSLG